MQLQPAGKGKSSTRVSMFLCLRSAIMELARVLFSWSVHHRVGFLQKCSVVKATSILEMPQAAGMSRVTCLIFFCLCQPRLSIGICPIGSAPSLCSDGGRSRPCSCGRSCRLLQSQRQTFNIDIISCLGFFMNGHGWHHCMRSVASAEHPYIFFHAFADRPPMPSQSTRSAHRLTRTECVSRDFASHKMLHPSC